MATSIRPFKSGEMVEEIPRAGRTLQVTAAEIARIREAMRTDLELRGLVSYAGAAGVSRTRLYGSLLRAIEGLLVEVRAAIE